MPIPPHSIESEMAVLGAMLLGEKEAVAEGMESLKADDFYRDAHVHLFEAMRALWSRSEPVDIITLKDELQRRGILEALGGIDYLLQLGDLPFTTANLTMYAKTVKDKSIKRQMLTFANDLAGEVFYDAEDADAIHSRAEEHLFTLGGKTSASGSKDTFQPLRSLLGTELDEIEARGHEGGDVTGLDTGFVDLNHMTGGWQSGDLVIVAARPAMGKTAMAIQTGMVAAMEQRHVAVFSLEMGANHLVQRILCAEAEVDATHIRTGKLSRDEWQRLMDATARLWDATLWIDDTNDLSVAEMRARARRFASRHGGLDLVIVDYLQLARGSNSGSSTFENKNAEVTEIAKGLKNMAREIKAPVIALSQLSRKVEQREDKRPMLSDLRDSGSIEAEADVVTFIYRPAYYEQQRSRESRETRSSGARGSQRYETAPPPPSPSPASPEADSTDGEEAEIIIGKHRKGPTGTVKLSFRPYLTKFGNLAPSWRQEGMF